MITKVQRFKPNLLKLSTLLIFIIVMSGCSNKQAVEDNVEVVTPPTIIQQPAYVSEYEDALEENQRYIWEYSAQKDTSKQTQEEIVESVSGTGPVKLNSLDELFDRLQIANLDFYFPEYVPLGFEVKDIGIYYYMCPETFDIKKSPIRDEVVEKGVNFKVYELNDNYKNYVRGFYVIYQNDEGNSVDYRYGLSLYKGENTNDLNTPISKENFLIFDDSKFLVNDKNIELTTSQAIEQREVFTGVPGKSYYYSPDYYKSVEMNIRGEGIQKDEIIKIAESIYKFN